MRILRSIFHPSRTLSGAAVVLVISLVCLPIGLSLLSRLERIAPPNNVDWMQVYFHQGAARRAVLEAGEFDYFCPLS